MNSDRIHTVRSRRGVAALLAPALAGAAVLLAALPARAGSDKLGDTFHVDAFGTVGLSWSGLDQPRYRTDYANLNGIGEQPTPKYDSRIGLQLGWTPSERFEVNLQGLLNRDVNDQTRIHISWAYLLTHLSSEWSLKLGRFRNPVYLYADTLDIGYAYPWARPPVEVYTTLATFHSTDGVMLSYRHALADGVLRIDAHVDQTRGRKKGGQGGDSDIKADIVGVSGTLTQGAFEYFAAASLGHVDADSVVYKSLLAACAPAVYPACNDYTLTGIRIPRLALGLRYDDAKWMFAAEMARTRPDTLALANETAGYVSGGRYIGNWLPYVSYAKLHAGGPMSETRTSPQMNQLLTALRRGKSQQHTWSAGLRWDATANLAVKLQGDKVFPDNGSPGLFTGALPAGRHSLSVFTLTLDWTL